MVRQVICRLAAVKADMIGSATKTVAWLGVVTVDARQLKCCV
jgi:hypothetical protein